MDLSNKTIAITGSTGGLGKEICEELAKLGANLVFINRNLQKSQQQAQEIISTYPNTKIDIVVADLENIESVKDAVSKLEKLNFDTLILNAGIYNVPIKKCSTGYNNIFQVNFVSQYYLAKELLKMQSLQKIVAVGSIAYKFAKLNINDVDYSSYKKQNKIYGNSKRFLMCSLLELFKNQKEKKLCVVHPGVTLTNMTNHYHKLINWFVKWGVKTFFPSPKKASKNLLYGLENNSQNYTWIGPTICYIWGKPKQRKIKKISSEENAKMHEIAEDIYNKLR
ncbi:MAG: SDR family NAD(P)-dependent oxidoreductase [Clostridia bacterium]|nr:SDR family NAD(P)-dependent oxidoreductase [Clostridia bacterium]